MQGNGFTLIPTENTINDERIKKYYVSSIENNVMTTFGLITVDTERKIAVGKIYNDVESINSNQMLRERKKKELQNYLKFNMNIKNIKIISL